VFVVVRVMWSRVGDRLERDDHLCGEAAKVTSTNQFFNFILECFAVFCSVTMVTVVAAIFGHISIGGSGSLAWLWDKVSLQGLIKEAGSGDIKGSISSKAGLAGLSWSGIRAGGGGVGLAVVAA